MKVKFDAKKIAEILRDVFDREPAEPPVCSHSGVILYGAGELGKLALRYLKYIGVDVKYIMDIGAGESHTIDGIDVVRPTKNTHKDDTYILVSTASVPFCEVERFLSDNGYQNIVPFYDYAQTFVREHPLNNGWFAGGLSDEDKNGISLVIENLSDDYSVASYLQFLYWRLFREDLIFDEYPVMKNNRYFIDEMCSKITDNERYIDVGAYDGRVFERLIAITDNKIDSATLIEPDMYNIELLEETIAMDIPDSILDKIQVVQSVATDIDGSVGFSHGFGFASRECDIKSTNTDSVRIDNLNLNPSFLKIHTEGSELVVLHGAMETLVNSRPKIASTLYHSRDGLWKTMTYLISLLGEYDFYFRLHSWCGTGAVVYAIPR